MRHECPDRVPVMCQLALGHYFLHSGHEPAEIWFDSEVFVRTLIEFQQRYRFDGFLINVPGRPPDWRRWLSDQRRRPARTADLEQRPGDSRSRRTTTRTRCWPTAAICRGPITRWSIRRPGDVPHVPGYVWNTWHAPTLFDVPADADLTDPAAYPDWLTRGLRRLERPAPTCRFTWKSFRR